MESEQKSPWGAFNAKDLLPEEEAQKRRKRKGRGFNNGSFLGNQPKCLTGGDSLDLFFLILN